MPPVFGYMVVSELSVVVKTVSDLRLLRLMLAACERPAPPSEYP